MYAYDVILISNKIRCLLIKKYILLCVVFDGCKTNKKKSFWTRPRLQHSGRKLVNKKIFLGQLTTRFIVPLFSLHDRTLSILTLFYLVTCS